MGDLDDRRRRAHRDCVAGESSGPRVVHDHPAGVFDDPAQHGIAEIASVTCRRRARPPELLGELPHPFAVVVDKLRDVGITIKPPEQEVLQDRVVENDHPGPLQR